MKKIVYGILIAVVLLLPCKSAIASQTEEQKEEQVYGIGSVSKMFGTAAIMKLAEQGKVDINALVTDYIKEFEMADDRYRQITVRMLLNHSSGLMGTTFQSTFLLGKSEVDYHKILLENLKKQKLKADPGEYSVYCNDGFTLAEIIIERVSGMSFAEFIKKEFTEPLGMQDTFMPEEIADMKSLAPIFYGNRQLPYENIQCLASGGIYSTAKDLCRFSNVFMGNGNGILTKESIDAMAAPEYLNDKLFARKGDSSFNYGLGWDSVESYPYSAYGIKALSKGGDTGNYSASLTVLPEQNISIAITTSGGESSQCLMAAQEIIAEVLKEEGLLTTEQEEKAVPKASEQKESAVIPDKLKQYEGIYAAGHIWKLEFTKQNTARLTSMENGSDMVQEYIYTTEGKFVSSNGKYISYDGMVQASDGISGITSFSFSKEPNGKTYMIGTTYMMSEGLGKFALSMPFAEKISENEISDKVSGIWEARNGHSYYLISEPYNSSYYFKTPSIKVETMEKLRGYVGASAVKNCRIVDENHAVCELDLSLMTGRDLCDYNFYWKQGKEYLDMGGFTYLREDDLQDSKELIGDIRMDSLAQWYQITEKDAGAEIKIQSPEKGSYVIYDKNDKCTAGNLLKGEKATILLPKDGKVLLLGSRGSTFTILR